MVVRMALVTVLRAMLVAVVVMAVVMPAAAGIAMRVSMGLGMGVGVVALRMRLGMAVSMGAVIATVVMAVMIVAMVGMIVSCVIMSCVIVAAVVVAGMIAIGVVVVIGAALGLERPVHGIHRATLPAHHLRQDMVVLDVDRVGGDFGRGMTVADVPGDAHQPQRVLRANLEQALRRGLDQHEPAIFQLDGVAVTERSRLVEIEQDAEPAIGRQGEAAAVAIVMVERQRIDDAVWPDGGLANDGGGAKHDGTSVTEWDQSRSIDRGSITSTTGGAVTQAPRTAASHCHPRAAALQSRSADSEAALHHSGEAQQARPLGQPR